MSEDDALTGGPERRKAPSVRPVDLTGAHRHLRAALSAISAIAESFGRGTRRTLPFLLRQRVRLKLGEPAIGSPKDSRAASQGPSYIVLLGDPGGSGWASLTLNGPCLARMLEGSLGNSQVSEGASLGDSLTLAQRVLIAKIAEKLGQDLIEAIKKETGLSLSVTGSRALGGDDEEQDEMSEGLYLDLTFDTEGAPASFVIAMSAEAIDEAVRENEEQDNTRGDPRLLDALADVRLPLVAELGRVTMGLGNVVKLEVGQVLRLPTLVESPVPMTVAGITKFQVTPVTSRGQLAVQVVARHGN